MPTDLNRKTEWISPEEIFWSQYGMVSGNLWCQYEIKRFAKKGQIVKIINNKDKPLIALSK